MDFDALERKIQSGLKKVRALNRKWERLSTLMVGGRKRVTMRYAMDLTGDFRTADALQMVNAESSFEQGRLHGMAAALNTMEGCYASYITGCGGGVFQLNSRIITAN